MAFDDFLDAEVGIAVAATAALFSPQVRGVLRRGAVYALAGVLRVGDTLAPAARDVAARAQQVATAAAQTAQNTAASVQEAAQDVARPAASGDAGADEPARQTRIRKPADT